ncbi:MAG TPA: tRNA lysidine(34) synthetase TilS [Ectothiorhodospiraceae bacterium]|nr:tRNA lysidine(34) synthetase TilS [Ectothiorhodospiraceae bacterium]
MTKAFHPEQLIPILQRLPRAHRYWLAFSGGLDSTVLLHALSQLKDDIPLLSVIHVDHGLSSDSASWSAQCRCQCDALDVEFHEVKVEIERNGCGIEAAAREARYAAFGEMVGEGEMLLTAHHQDDQAETLLLQLLRGGAVRGLAAMPEYRHFAAGGLARPLLGFSREVLQAYAEAQGLAWIDDPSNFDTTLERNFLRHDLLPLLEQRRGGVKSLLARSAGHIAESAGLLDELAAQDLQTVSLADGQRLSISALQVLSVARQRNLLRYWLRRTGFSVPDSRNLQRILDEVLPAAEDAAPLVRWSDTEIRRYRDDLYVMSTLPPAPHTCDPQLWSGEEIMVLAGGLGELRLTRRQGDGLRGELLQSSELSIGWRCGGEALTLTGRDGHHSLKKLYQEAAVPPWERSRRPLLFIDGQLAQVAGLWSDSRFTCGKNEQGICFEWSPAIEMRGENNDN